MPASPSRRPRPSGAGPRTPVARRPLRVGTATAITGLLAAPLLLLHTAGPAAATPAPEVTAGPTRGIPGDTPSAAATVPTVPTVPTGAPRTPAPTRTVPTPAPLPTLKIPGATATSGPGTTATPAPTGAPRRTGPRRSAPAAPAPAAPAPRAPGTAGGPTSTRAADRLGQPAAVRRFDDRATGVAAAAPAAAEAAPPAPPVPAAPGAAPAAPQPSSSGMSLKVSGSGGSPLDSPVSLVLLLGAITFIPALLIMTTAFTRVVIVLGFVRSALGTNGIPPNQVVIGLSLFLSLFVMAPTFSQANHDALQPLTHGQITQTVALQRAVVPFREFMLKQVRDEDLSMFVKLAGDERPAKPADVPTTTLVPAFLLSELRTAFLIGFVIFIPFIIIDLVVSAALSAMGMVMLPPALISLPFKLLLFVAANGWALVVDSLVSSFHH